MKLTCVSTGSQMGNSYILQLKDGKFIVLDLGAKYKEILRACDYRINDIRFALYTHAHADHLNPATLKELKKRSIYVFSKPKDNTRYSIGNIAFTPFPVPHTNNDGTDCPCKAFLIEADGEKLLYMTDWKYCKFNLSKYKINHFLIAINYTELEDDNQGKIGHVLQGHSSLETAIEFLKANVTDACRSIIACHLSQRNADELKIMDALVKTAPTIKNLYIAKKGITYDLGKE